MFVQTLIVGTRYNRLAKAVLTITHNLCVGSKIRKTAYPCKPQFEFIKVEFEGLFISRTCYPDSSFEQLLIISPFIIPYGK